MWGNHLKRRGHWWHYYRAVPGRFQDVEARREICFSLRTRDFLEAKVKAAQISLDLEDEWQLALDLGVSFESRNAAERYAAAAQAQVRRGLKPLSADELTDDALLSRLCLLVAEKMPPPDQTAVLGLAQMPARWAKRARRFSDTAPPMSIRSSWFFR